MEKRVIKFRAWDQEAADWNKKYSTNVGGEHNPLTEMYDWEALQEYSFDIFESNWNIMQFTGLTDKNGFLSQEFSNNRIRDILKKHPTFLNH